MNPLFVFVLLLLSFLIEGNSSSDVDCLLEFKKGIHKDPMDHVMSSWVRDALDSDGCPQNWHGIECSNGLVTAIKLAGLGLVGDLKFFTLYGLRSLKELNLSNNSLTGRLVPALGSMYSLQSLDLSGNSFYGPIPGRLTGLWGLTYLNLSSNNFTGSLPDGMENLQQLKVVDLHSNSLFGDVGDLLVRFRNAEHIDLSSNMFSGGLAIDAQNISSMAGSVRHLNLSLNVLDGQFFSNDAAQMFTRLEILDARGNQLTGTVPSFGSLSSLRVLRVGNNRLYGSIPGNLLDRNSSGLVELDLSNNGLSGSLAVITSSTMKILNLSSNGISGTLPSDIGSCKTVDLSKNMISGDLSALRTWSNTIEVIDLSSNSLTGTFPNETSEFPNLTTIKLTNNSLVGILPPSLGRYTKLTVMDLSFNKLSGPILSDFFMSLSMKSLDLSNNRFTGTIPLQSSDISLSASLSLPSYSQLESLDLSDNLLDGSLSPEIGNMSALIMLNLGKNNFSGQIPSEIGKLQSLEYLDLSLNKLSGSIPDVFPPSLKMLNLSYNNLSGTLPESLRKLPESSFHPGNSLLSISGLATRPAGQGTAQTEGNARNSVRTAGIIIGSIAGAAVMVLLLMAVLYRAQVLELGSRNRCSLCILSRSIKQGRYTHPSSFRFTHNIDPVAAQSSYTPHFPPPDSIPEHQQKQFTSESVQWSSVETKEVIPEPENRPDRSPNNGRSSPGAHLSSPALYNDSVTYDQPVMLYAYSPDRLSGDLFFLDSSLIFTVDELSRAPAEVLGRSSHGTSYKATLDGGHVLTVKWLREGLVKRKKDFAKEAKKLGTVRHPNIVPIRGYYWGPKEHEKLIVSDYMNAASLAELLYGTSPRRQSPLSFSKRLDIAVDVARCLCYLHYEKGLPHGNLKPTNILLAYPDLSVRLTDYSLHRLMTSSSTADHILNLGALGYRAPELATASKPHPSSRADVYSFGVILMELLTGKSAGDIISGNSGAVDLTDWVQLCSSQGRITECYDRDIFHGEEYPKEVDEVLTISLRCIRPVNERPDIRTIFEQLSSIVAV
ncbi:putative inactive receptor kinase [Nymphaea thermarum]|nr:putative inactive receptor kinase [Nymphaea thermarum]